MPAQVRRNHLDGRVALQLPSVVTLDPPGRRERGVMWVRPAGKSPKLRFKPGSFIRYERKLYEIMFAYRVIGEPSEWRYCCEERQDLISGEVSERFPGLTEALGAGETTPRVVTEIFTTNQEAWFFFVDIPVGRNRITLLNKQLVRGAQVVSSGEVLGVKPNAIGS